jgi:acetoacetyl-CoA synthetase
MSKEKPIWQPSPDRAAETNMARFMNHVRREYAAEIENYAGLYRWSVENADKFWPAVWAFCGIKASQPWSHVLLDGDRMPGARWFPEARLNLAENLMRRGDRGDAFVFWDENGPRRRVSYADVYSDVSRAAQALAALGLRSGERAAAFIPNIPEAGMLALAALSQGTRQGAGRRIGVLLRVTREHPRVQGRC